MIIKYASAPCGSGKTYNLVKRACNLARRGRRVIIGQPTRDLTDQAWSRKRLQTLVGTEEKATYQLVASGAMGLFNGSSFLWQANKSQDNPFGHQGYQAAEQAAWTERLP